MRPSCFPLRAPRKRKHPPKRTYYVPSLSFLYVRPSQQTNAGWLGAFCYSSPLAQGGAPTNLVMPTGGVSRLAWSFRSDYFFEQRPACRQTGHDDTDTSTRQRSAVLDLFSVNSAASAAAHFWRQTSQDEWRRQQQRWEGPLHALPIVSEHFD